jgi:hypothetical protein
MKILNKIIKKNLKRKGRNILAVSLSLLDALLEKSKFEAQLIEISSYVDESGFVLLAKIPEDIKEFLSLNCVATELSVEEGSEKDSEHLLADRFGFLTEVFVNEDRRRAVGYHQVLYELEKAFKYYDRYKCEFIDSFHDVELINTKAQMLSVLMVLRKLLNEKSLLEKAYSLLKKLDPEFELLSGGMEDFYKQLDWYSRTGEVRGCIIA